MQAEVIHNDRAAELERHDSNIWRDKACGIGKPHRLFLCGCGWRSHEYTVLCGKPAVQAAKLPQQRLLEDVTPCHENQTKRIPNTSYLDGNHNRACNTFKWLQVVVHLSDKPRSSAALEMNARLTKDHYSLPKINAYAARVLRVVITAVTLRVAYLPPVNTACNNHQAYEVFF